MDTLTAVNTMLRVIGQVPVSSIPSSGLADSTMASEVLKEYTKELQTEGFDFNRQVRKELTPDVNGHIFIELDPLVDESLVSAKSYYPYRRFTTRGSASQLYDLDNQTYVFNKPVYVDIITAHKFDELPPSLQRYVLIRAARVFANRVIGSQEQNGYNAEDEARARAEWMQYVSNEDELNVLSSSSGHRLNTFRPASIFNRN